MTTEADKLRAAAKTATQQATAPAASDDAKIGRYLTVPSGVGMWNFLALTFCLMVGTAGLPHILTRYYTTPSVREARTSVAWSLFFIFLLYFTAPAYAAFARFVIYAKLVGTQIAELPRWVTLVAAGRPLRSHRQERRRHRAVGGLRREVHRLRRSLDA